ncbi:hypothetical protein PoB_001376400 [Plakobranchus ocellatus]|uniref:Uncharacterized protein n=1 Tax=Plakobranchus ocellatus TaxID=259542 RepID=A0AAV3YYR5_9GAST|nr:hypothetical protein PoB_001376400 [Plakobranchus ocellatus]
MDFKLQKTQEVKAERVLLWMVVIAEKERGTGAGDGAVADDGGGIDGDARSNDGCCCEFGPMPKHNQQQIRPLSWPSSA